MLQRKFTEHDGQLALCQAATKLQAINYNGQVGKLYKEIVAHLERENELELNALEESDDLPFPQ